MSVTLPGIHHVTAIATDPQTNVDFYTTVLGLRLVKKTVNFDDPGTYHVYFGDESGSPGTIMTFFPWPQIRPGRHGKGQVTVTSFSVPEGSLGYWQERLATAGVETLPVCRRFAEDALPLLDPDGLQLELVAREGTTDLPGGSAGPVPVDSAIRGFHGVTVALEGFEGTASVLTDIMGYGAGGNDGNRFRFVAGKEDTAPGRIVDLLCSPDAPSGIVAAGTVHHVAYRVSGDEEQLAVRERLLSFGMNVTPVLDRKYFRSIYFREPGGVLFEIATDPPGFAVDEDLDSLGGELQLPGWLESKRQHIENALPPLVVRR